MRECVLDIARPASGKFCGESFFIFDYLDLSLYEAATTQIIKKLPTIIVVHG